MWGVRQSSGDYWKYLLTFWSCSKIFREPHSGNFQKSLGHLWQSSEGFGLCSEIVGSLNWINFGIFGSPRHSRPQSPRSFWSAPRNHDLWLVPIFWACAEYLFSIVFCLFIVSTANQKICSICPRQSLRFLGADQKNRGLWGREWSPWVIFSHLQSDFALDKHKLNALCLNQSEFSILPYMYMYVNNCNLASLFCC